MKEDVVKVRSGKTTYYLNKNMFGVLENDNKNPLCCITVSNNSLSIDFWKGCSYQCAYCHVQGIYPDLDENLKMISIPRERTEFSVREIVESLVNHKYFKKDYTVISIATSSTEPFANKKTTENTLEIMETFIDLGMKNPFWIVTKAGVPDLALERLSKVSKNGNKVMISFCWANNPKNIEPVKNDRFKNIDKLKEMGIYTSWYLRPLVKEWGANFKNLELMFNEVSQKYLQYIDIIVPGGLRWTEGIEFGLKVIRKQKMPKLLKKYNKKTLSNRLKKQIIKLSNKYFKGTPIYFNSSCAISHMLDMPSITLTYLFNRDSCNMSICKNRNKALCKNFNLTSKDYEKIEEILNKQEIDIKIKKINVRKNIVSNPKFKNFNYSEQQQIKKVIANYIIEEKNYDSK